LILAYFAPVYNRGVLIRPRKVTAMDKQQNTNFGGNVDESLAKMAKGIMDDRPLRARVIKLWMTTFEDAVDEEWQQYGNPEGVDLEPLSILAAWIMNNEDLLKAFVLAYLREFWTTELLDDLIRSSVIGPDDPHRPFRPK
jgi:hypothetical protein